MASTVNSDRFTFDHIPTAVTNVKHNGTSFGTITRKTTDALFTAPASLTAGTVEYSASTGNLNFSSADVTSYDGQAIVSTYTVYLEGEKQVAYLAREVIKEIRTGWRTDTTIKGLFYPVLISANPLNIDEDLGIYRYVVEYQFNAFNLGEGL
jgi:hypothetical protein